MCADENSTFSLLSQLWLHEPDADMLARARDLSALGADLPAADPSALAPAYADLLLLNVYPYGTAYTDEWGELNTPAALRLSERYVQYGYRPPELSTVAAPDHLGLCLGLLDYLPPAAWQGEDDGPRMRHLSELAAWAPVCCFAAERDPSAHPFYRALAAFTRELIVAAVRPPQTAADVRVPAAYAAGDELRLRDVVRFFLAPARCGLFLSRARLGAIANALGMRLPFGSRFEVCEWLFASAGELESVEPLLRVLRAEASDWASAYTRWGERYPGWRPAGQPWLARLAVTERLLSEMQALARFPLDVEYEDPAGHRLG